MNESTWSKFIPFDLFDFCFGLTWKLRNQNQHPDMEKSFELNQKKAHLIALHVNPTNWKLWEQRQKEESLCRREATRLLPCTPEAWSLRSVPASIVSWSIHGVVAQKRIDVENLSVVYILKYFMATYTQRKTLLEANGKVIINIKVIKQQQIEIACLIACLGLRLMPHTGICLNSKQKAIKFDFYRLSQACTFSMAPGQVGDDGRCTRQEFYVLLLNHHKIKKSYRRASQPKALNSAFRSDDKKTYGKVNKLRGLLEKLLSTASILQTPRDRMSYIEKCVVHRRHNEIIFTLSIVLFMLLLLLNAKSKRKRNTFSPKQKGPWHEQTVFLARRATLRQVFLMSSHLIESNKLFAFNDETSIPEAS